MSWILVLGTVIGLSIGQVLFKMGAQRLNANAHEGLIAWFNWPTVAAVILYGVTTLLWIGALRTLPLRIAYPAIALCYLIVPLLAHFFLREPLTARVIAGGLIILAGVIVATWSE